MKQEFQILNRTQCLKNGLLTIEKTTAPVRKHTGWFNDENATFLRNYDDHLHANFAKFTVIDATLLVFNLGPTDAYDLKYEILVGDNLLLPDDSSLYYLHMLQNKFIYGQIDDGKICLSLDRFKWSNIDSLGVFIGGRHNYGHFLVDIFSKSFYLDRHEILSYLTSEPYQHQIINYFRDKCTIGLNTGYPIAIKVSRLTLISTPPPSSVWLTYNKRFQTLRDPRKKIFLLKHGGNQRVQNLLEVITALRRYNFEIIEAQNIAFASLVERMNSASCIITLTEATSANIYFADPRALVICLLPTTWALSARPDMQWALAVFAGAENFIPLLCQPMNPSESPITGKFYVPIDKLCSLLDNI